MKFASNQFGSTITRPKNRLEDNWKGAIFARKFKIEKGKVTEARFQTTSLTKSHWKRDTLLRSFWAAASEISELIQINKFKMYKLFVFPMSLLFPTPKLTQGFWK